MCVDDSNQRIRKKDGTFRSMAHPLVKGRTYVVRSIRPGCPHMPFLVDVGMPTEPDAPISGCYDCNISLEGRWHSAQRFVPEDPLMASLSAMEDEGVTEDIVKELEEA